MNRRHFQRLAIIRLRESEILLLRRCYHGSYYLSGYSIECAIKACIAKKTRKHDFPDKKTVMDSYTHDLSKLVKVAGLQGELDNEMRLNPSFASNWATVKDWSEDSRYLLNVKRQDAYNIYQSIVDVHHGVLAWLRRFW